MRVKAQAFPQHLRAAKQQHGRKQGIAVALAVQQPRQQRHGQDQRT